MRINYLLIADAVNESADGRLNILGANWIAIRVKDFPSVRPMAIAFGATTYDETEIGSIPIVVDIEEPNGRSVVLETTFDLARTDGPPGAPVGSMSAVTSGALEMEAPGLYRLNVRVGAAIADHVFMVHGESVDAKSTKPAARRRRRANQRSTRDKHPAGGSANE